MYIVVNVNEGSNRCNSTDKYARDKNVKLDRGTDTVERFQEIKGIVHVKKVTA